MFIPRQVSNNRQSCLNLAQSLSRNAAYILIRMFLDKKNVRLLISFTAYQGFLLDTYFCKLQVCLIIPKKKKKRSRVQLQIFLLELRQQSCVFDF